MRIGRTTLRNDNTVSVLLYNKIKGDKGLLDETPMKILLTISKDEKEILKFDLADDAKKYLV